MKNMAWLVTLIVLFILFGILTLMTNRLAGKLVRDILNINGAFLFNISEMNRDRAMKGKSWRVVRFVLFSRQEYFFPPEIARQITRLRWVYALLFAVGAAAVASSYIPWLGKG